MTSSEIFKLYSEICSLKEIKLEDLVEDRLNLLLKKYEADLQESYLNLEKYDILILIKEMNRNAKFR